MTVYGLTIFLDVHDEQRLIAAAKAYDPEMAEEITDLASALEYLIHSGVAPLDAGFEIIDRAVEPLPFYREGRR